VATFLFNTPALQNCGAAFLWRTNTHTNTRIDTRTNTHSNTHSNTHKYIVINGLQIRLRFSGDFSGSPINIIIF